MATDAERRALQVIRQLGVFRVADLEAHGIPRGRVYQLLSKRDVTRHARGVYTASNHSYTPSTRLPMSPSGSRAACSVCSRRCAFTS